MTDALARFAIRAGWPARASARPLCIGHRGACAHANENTLSAFRAAARLGADMWETDARLTRDGVVVLSHDAHVTDVDGRLWTIADHDAATLTAVDLARGGRVPALAEAIALAKETDCGLYVEVKAPEAAEATVAELCARPPPYAGVGSFDHATVRALVAAASRRLPVAVLVRVGEDPFVAAAATGAEIIHLCWERAGDKPDRLLTPELFARAEQAGLTVVIWHEERQPVLDRLMRMPVAGICTDRPELMNRFGQRPDRPIEVVCHRGFHIVAPENTLHGARLCFDMGYTVELDVRRAADGGLAVIHDATLDRTTDASGPVSARTMADLATVSAGRRFDRFFAGEGVRPLADFLRAAGMDGRLYVEIKDVDVSAVLAIVREHDMLQRVLFWSPDRRVLTALRAESASARLMVQRSAYSTLRAALDEFRPAVVEYDVESDDLDEMNACVAAGAAPMAKYFGADPSVFSRVLRSGATLVNLNRPDIFRAVYDTVA